MSPPSITFRKYIIFWWNEGSSSKISSGSARIGSSNWALTIYGMISSIVDCVVWWVDIMTSSTRIDDVTVRLWRHHDGVTWYCDLDKPRPRDTEPLALRDVTRLSVTSRRRRLRYLTLKWRYFITTPFCFICSMAACRRMCRRFSRS